MDEGVFKQMRQLFAFLPVKTTRPSPSTGIAYGVFDLLLRIETRRCDGLRMAFVACDQIHRGALQLGIDS